MRVDDPGAAVLRIERCGPSTTIQDLGRHGYRHLGVTTSGAADRGSLRLANRLVGNPDGHAAIEVTLGGLELRLLHAATVAVTGARSALAAHRPGAATATQLAWAAPVTLPAGTAVTLGAPRVGVRAYVAIRGGIDVEPVLGSRSTDVLGGIGPAPLGAGDLLRAGPEPAGPPVEVPVTAELAVPHTLGIVAGPRDDWFTPDAIATLTGNEWIVGAESDRVGIHLSGSLLERSRGGELASEPMIPGCIQVPPDGQPIVLGADAPTTGGYPVIAVVHSADLDALGQLRPGDRVRFGTRRAART